jgi:hypothetical protein
MIVEIGFAIVCLWAIWNPQACIDSMNGWNRTFGGSGRIEARSWLVRFAGLALLCVLVWALWSSRP